MMKYTVLIEKIPIFVRDKVAFIGWIQILFCG